ncbi:MAG: hypothetical protein ABIH47_07070 [Candidatus Omnitrophota bacterium]
MELKFEKYVKRNIIFLVREKSRISIRRYLLISALLAKHDIQSCYICISKNVKSDIEYEIVDMQLNISPIIIDYENNTQKTETKNFVLQKGMFYKNVDLSERVNKIVNRHYQSFRNNEDSIKQLLDRVNPLCVFYDLSIIALSRMILYWARRKKIPLLSMEHGEGIGEQYSNLPLFADRYIAYSRYNRDIYQRMGVPVEHIVVTGDPMNDYTRTFDPSEIKRIFCKKFDSDFKKKIILICLKPATDEFMQLNKDFVCMLSNIFAHDDKFLLVVKPHVSGFSKNYVFEEFSNILAVEKDYPLSRLLCIAAYVFTYMSSVIVESIYFKNKMFVINRENTIAWPPWHHFNVYKKIDFNEIPQQVRLIQEERLTQEYFFSEENRRQFLNYFRFAYDGKSTQRVVDEIFDVHDSFLTKKRINDCFVHQ